MTSNKRVERKTNSCKVNSARKAAKPLAMVPGPRGPERHPGILNYIRLTLFCNEKATTRQSRSGASANEYRAISRTMGSRRRMTWQRTLHDIRCRLCSSRAVCLLRLCLKLLSCAGLIRRKLSLRPLSAPCMIWQGVQCAFSHVVVSWQPLAAVVMRPDSFLQMQLLIGRMCLNFDLGGLLQGPVPASRACRPFAVALCGRSCAHGEPRSARLPGASARTLGSLCRVIRPCNLRLPKKSWQKTLRPCDAAQIALTTRQRLQQQIGRKCDRQGGQSLLHLLGSKLIQQQSLAVWQV